MSEERDLSDKTLEELEARLVALQREADDKATARVPASGAAGPPITLVLIDGCEHVLHQGVPG